MGRDEGYERDIEYWMVALGTAVGFGCIWRFPYMVFRNGGAVFLIPYYLLIWLFGAPIMTLETAIGQYFRAGAVVMYRKVSDKYQGIAWVGIAACFCVGTLYIYLLAYVFLYMKETIMGLEYLDAPEDQILKLTREFYYSKILNISTKKDSLEGFHWPLLVTVILAWLLIYSVIRKGISQTGKIAVFTVLSPYVLLAVFLLRVSVLDGFGQGLIYLFYPDFTKLFTFQIWKDAMTQVAFQLSVGQTMMIIFSSFRKVNRKYVLASRLIPLINSLTGVVASLIIFGYLGYYCKKYNLQIETLDIAGPGLVFITIPACLSTMWWPTFWIFLMMINLVLIGIDSQFGICESCIYFIDDLKLEWNGEVIDSNKTRIAVMVIMGLCGLPIATRGGTYVLELIDTFGFAIPCSISMFGTIYIWVKKTNVQSLFEQLSRATAENVPEFEIKALHMFGIPISLAMIGICTYSTIVNGIINNNFSFTFMIIGICITAIATLPGIYYYLRYKDQPENDEPYSYDLILDPFHGADGAPSLKDQLKELQEQPPSRSEKSEV
jgi:SNF family Na+-dependent transporter